MRIALIPLDSRPPNLQFPQRLAAIGGIELLLPPAGLLGGLHSAADSPALLEWLTAGASRCDAAVLSLDALLYGGLVQSRREGQLLSILQLGHALFDIARACPLYAFLCVPRLGMTVKDQASLLEHEALRRHLAQPDDQAGQAAPGIKGSTAVDPVLMKALELRARSAGNAHELLRLASELDFGCLHFAVEDNATSGPHLAEAAKLLEAGRHENAARLAEGRRPLPLSVFDGADECAVLLLARAARDLQSAPALPLRLSVHPASPGPERYTGMFESHSLAEGLDFISHFLGFDFNAAEPLAQWLVTHGVQPQPDVFAVEPRKAFNNPFLLPDAGTLQGDNKLPLFISDLAAANGFNPFLAARLEHAAARLQALLGWNTNFNTLGSSAALISLAMRSSAAPRGGEVASLESPSYPSVVASLDSPSSGVAAGGSRAAPIRRFLLERLADDVVYQSIARPEILARCKADGINPFDFGDLAESKLQGLRLIVRRHWREWCAGAGADLLAALGIPQQAAALLHFDFPWRRAFEIEAEAPEL
ncbi:DUF4127 family protein [bacterium]|nr:DUF4127 family protein [bacterium]